MQGSKVKCRGVKRSIGEFKEKISVVENGKDVKGSA